ncbi:MAG: B12-binding domain-containing protein [Alphaproteobacteria bacterium]
MEDSTDRGLGREDWGDRRAQVNQGKDPDDKPNQESPSLGQRMIGLAATIESEIVPRLMLALQLQREKPKQPQAAQHRSIGADDVEEFARLVLTHDEEISSAFVHSLKEQGVPIRSLFSDLLAPAARQFGTMWESDEIDFVRVTICLGRLQHLLHELGRLVDVDSAQFNPFRRILLAAAPGEQHTFGLLMTSEFLRHEGWDVNVWPASDVDALIKEVHDTWYGVVGLSLSSDVVVEPVRDVVARIREESQNERVGIILGGRSVVQNPALVEEVGADMLAESGADASAKAEILLDAPTKDC